jgi:hypothetical protein
VGRRGIYHRPRVVLSEAHSHERVHDHVDDASPWSERGSQRGLAPFEVERAVATLDRQLGCMVRLVVLGA